MDENFLEIKGTLVPGDLIPKHPTDLLGLREHERSRLILSKICSALGEECAGDIAKELEIRTDLSEMIKPVRARTLALLPPGSPMSQHLLRVDWEQDVRLGNNTRIRDLKGLLRRRKSDTGLPDDDVLRELSKGRYSTKILNCMGLRSQESPARAKRENFLLNKRLSSKSRQVDEWLPIQDWTEEEVWARIKKSGVPHHRAYDLGMPRLSCVFCIFAPRPALILAGKHNRELLNEYVETEARIGHTFRLGTPMSEIKEAVEADEAIEPISSNWNM